MDYYGDEGGQGALGPRGAAKSQRHGPCILGADVMTRTRDKLNEAKHYLQGLRQSQATRDEFIRAFSAFVSAARSVTYVMQDEFRGADDFIAWYRDKQAWMKTQPLFEFMNEMRVENLHRSDSRPTMRVTLPVGDQSVSVDAEFEVMHPSGVKEVAESERLITAPPGTVVRWIPLQGTVL